MNVQDSFEYSSKKYYQIPSDSDDEDSYLDDLGIQACNRYFQEDYDIDVAPLYSREDEDLIVIPDEDYADYMGFPPPVEFPNSACLENDVRALVTGVLMAKSEKLETGLTAEEFDQILQEITGKRGTCTSFINIEELGLLMNMTTDEIGKAVKDKSNILLNKMLDTVVKYNVTTNTFKAKIGDQSPLRELYESMKCSSANTRTRQEALEKVKIDKMANLENRKKYMISNNMLVELIATAFADEESLTGRISYVVDYNKIRDVYYTMMTEETPLFRKYNLLLELDKIKEEIGPTLNQKSTNELFGRGTISKALSNPIFKRIGWSNEGKLLFKRNTDQPFDELMYTEAEFDEINEAIEENNRIKRSYYYNLNHQQKKDEEMQERTKTNEPANINSNTANISQKQTTPTQPTTTTQQASTLFGHPRDFTTDEEEEIKNNKPNNSNYEEISDKLKMEHACRPLQSRVGVWNVPIHSREKEFAFPPYPRTSSRLPSRETSNENIASIIEQTNGSRVREPSPIRPDSDEIHRELYGSESIPPVNRNTNGQNNRRKARAPSPVRYGSDEMRAILFESESIPTVNRYKQEHIVEDNSRSPSPQSMPQTELFVKYIVTHVYLHRHIEGAPRRYWSQIEKYIDFPFNKPETLLGPHWIEILQQNPNINILQTPSDYLFEWVRSDFDMSFSVSSRMR